MEELFVLDDLSSGTIKIVNSLRDLKRKGNYIVHSRITGRNLNVELWGTSANEDMYARIG